MNSDEMRERARQCRAKAKAETMLDIHSRAMLIVAAHIWEALAEQNDKLVPLDPWPDKAANDK
jgi:hypothetical protein